MQAVRQLDQQDADVVGHRQHQFAEILGLLSALGEQFELRQLGDAIDQPCDLGAEIRLDVGDGGGGIFHRVVQQRGRDGRGVEFQIGEDAGDFERMREIGIARGAFLRAVRLHGEDIGLVENRFVGARIIGPHALDERRLPHQRLAPRRHR